MKKVSIDSRIEKLLDSLDERFMRRHRLSLFDYRILCDSLFELSKYGRAKIISDAVRIILERYKFDVQIDGIGWVISL